MASTPGYEPLPVAQSERLLVRVDGLDASAVAAMLDASGALAVQPGAGLPGVYVATYPDTATAGAALRSLVGRSDVVWAEFDTVAEYSYEPNDPLFSDQLWAKSIDLPAAWSITGGREDIVVAVVDSGVSASHPDLQGKLLPGRDFLNGDSIPEDDVGHGTAVAGIIAARGDDGVGVAGVAMNVTILPVKVGSVAGAPISTLAAGITWAVDQGVDVINLSLVADQASLTLRDAVAYAYDNGVPVVTAAGNEPDAVTYPGAYPQPITVGASTFWGTLTGFSSRANRVDLIAPGSGVLAPWWSEAEGNTWANVSGTSFATPMVTGAIALLLSVDPDLTIEDLRTLLTSTALPPDSEVPTAGAGAGQLDAGASVRALIERAFDRTWAPLDEPVATGLVGRSWLWGPTSFASGFEDYAQATRGTRLVRYYDKSRMEVTNPHETRDSAWYVTNGLLAKELITGRMQTGDDSFVTRGAAQVIVAGDPGDPSAPTYADLRGLLDDPSLPPGVPITQVVDGAGRVAEYDSYAAYGVSTAWYVPETDHQIASVFWDYLNSDGLVLLGGQLVTDSLFNPTFFATGFPITEAYWTRVFVAGEERDVLVQCFERRCLTYTPSNSPEWRVEMGNVGQHYYQWRYSTPDTSKPPRANATFEGMPGDERGVKAAKRVRPGGIGFTP